MTRSVEIPDAAVEAACQAHHDAYVGWTETCDRDQTRAALVAARPYLMPSREALADLMNAHPIEAFNGSQIVCECNLTWQTNAEYRAHLADAVLALLNGES